MAASLFEMLMEMLATSTTIVPISTALLETPAALFETSLMMLLMAAALFATSTYFDKNEINFVTLSYILIFTGHSEVMIM